MKKKIIFSFLVCFLVFQTTGLVWGGNFSSSVIIQNKGIKKYKGIRLTPEILNTANSYHSDLLLLNQKSEMVPYFINRYREDTTKVTQFYDMKLIHSFVNDPDFYFDYLVVNPPKGDMQATSIEVTTENQNFVKNVSVLGSYDNKNWENVQSDLFYQVEGNQKLSLHFDGIKKFTYYRFQMGGLSERISFSSVKLVYNQELQSKEYFLETITPRFTVTTEGKLTKVVVDDIKNLTLYDIRIETDDMFKRSVSFAGYSKILYHLAFKNSQYKDLTIPMNGYQEINDLGLVTILNQDDKPIQIKKIVIRRYVEELVFDGSKADSFILKFGNPAIKEPPRYDVASYKENIIQEGYDLLPVGEIKTEPPPPPPPKPKNYQWLFNTIIVFVAILMGFILLIRVKKE
jgi:hypothetical protein